MAKQRNGWRWENTGGGVMRWVLGGFVIAGPKGAEPVEGRPCLVSHAANGHENVVEFPNPEAARRAVTAAMVDTSDEDDPCWVPSPLTEWMAANEESPDCADAAMTMLRSPDEVVYIGGGAAPLFAVRRSRLEV
jgi:hypothetical protein